MVLWKVSYDRARVCCHGNICAEASLLGLTQQALPIAKQVRIEGVSAIILQRHTHAHTWPRIFRFLPFRIHTHSQTLSEYSFAIALTRRIIALNFINLCLCMCVCVRARVHAFEISNYLANVPVWPLPHPRAVCKGWQMKKDSWIDRAREQGVPESIPGFTCSKLQSLAMLFAF